MNLLRIWELFLNNYTDMLYKYIESIEGNESFLKPFVALMDKQKRFKPITLLNGLSVYKQANTANYFYRINNSKWNLNTRSSCKTVNLDEAKIIALKAYSCYEVMDEFSLIKRKGESFIEFTRRMIFPLWELNMEQQVKERDACTASQLRKPMLLINALTI
jgi:hypothetical protein